MDDLTCAKVLLAGETTCAVVKDNAALMSTQRGVAPLLSLLASGRGLGGASAADRIVGKAAALLYAKMGVSAVYGEVMTEEAEAVLVSFGIAASCKTLVEKIRNRRGDGICPMEEAVLSLSSPDEAVSVLTARVKELGIDVDPASFSTKSIPSENDI